MSNTGAIINKSQKVNGNFRGIILVHTKMISSKIINVSHKING